MTMTKDEAVDIAYTAKDMTLEQLLEAYAKFQLMVVNTPNHMPDGVVVNGETLPLDGKPMGWQHALHGAMGLVTESSEILDAFKKEMYGKQRPLRPDNIREECGDVFFYLFLVMRGMQELGHDINLRTTIADNVVKLANRYIERFNV